VRSDHPFRAHFARVCVRASIVLACLQSIITLGATRPALVASSYMLHFRLTKRNPFCPQELKESFNYGLFCPPANGKAGKFLDEERRLLDYPFNGPVGYLEVSTVVAVPPYQLFYIVVVATF